MTKEEFLKFYNDGFGHQIDIEKCKDLNSIMEIKIIGICDDPKVLEDIKAGVTSIIRNYVISNYDSDTVEEHLLIKSETRRNYNFKGENENGK